MTMAVAPARGVPRELTSELREGVGRLATITLVGLVTGWFVVGVLSRLGMMLLAEVNPRFAGVTTDDGFAIGEFTLSGSLNLMFLVGTLFGVAGAGFYFALRELVVGPGWFRLLSISLGPGVVIGALLVSSSGVDFVLLEPVWLTIGIFVAIPATYVAILSLVAERLLARDQRRSTPLIILGLAAWLVTFPLLPLLAALLGGMVGLWWLRQRAPGRRLLAGPLPWLARGVLAVVFVLAVLDLVADARALA